jgi:hypothetical protein
MASESRCRTRATVLSTVSLTRPFVRCGCVPERLGRRFEPRRGRRRAVHRLEKASPKGHEFVGDYQRRKTFFHERGRVLLNHLIDGFFGHVALPGVLRSTTSGLSLAAARQPIADRHAAGLLDHRITGLNFCLHCLAASLRRVVGVPNGSAQFRRGDHDCCRALCGGSSQLRNQLLPKMID